jgi:hypothetical protein
MKNAENLNDDHIKPVERLDWLAPGESCSLQFGKTSVVIRLVDRKGRRARISVSASQNAQSESDAED